MRQLNSYGRAAGCRIVAKIVNWIIYAPFLSSVLPFTHTPQESWVKFPSQIRLFNDLINCCLAEVFSTCAQASWKYFLPDNRERREKEIFPEYDGGAYAAPLTRYENMWRDLDCFRNDVYQAGSKARKSVNSSTASRGPKFLSRIGPGHVSPLSTTRSTAMINVFLQ